MSEWEEFSAYRKMIRDAKAEAWDEGYREANEDLWRDGGSEGNPYRKAVQDD